MDSAWIPVIIAVIGCPALSGAVVWILNRPKTEAEITEKIVSAAGGIIDDLQTRVVSLEKKELDQDTKIRAQEAKINRLLRGISKLINQIQSVGLEPVWRPEEV